MADPRYGAGGEGFDETLGRMQKAAAASDELRRKEEQRASVEERSTGALTKNLGAREATADITDRLESSLRGSISALEAETRALNANATAWTRVNTARSGGSIGGVARAPRQAAAPEPIIAESPQIAQARYQDAIRAQAQAEIQQRQSRSAVTAAQRAGTSAEELAPLVAQREAANQAVTSAKAQARAAQANVTASEQAAQAQQEARATQQAENQRLNAAMAQHAAAERAAAEAAARQAAEADRNLGRLFSATAGAGAYGPAVARNLERNAILGQAIQPPGFRTSYPSSPLASAPVTRNFIAGPVGGGGVIAADEKFSADAQRANLNATNLEHMAGAQGRVNQMMQQSIAQYGASSQALQRHGALTSEFIQAFARGEVTLQEFQSQMLTTMGKFGGWALAGAAVYGVVDALRKLSEGAKEAQSGYVQLTRFIPGVKQGEATHTFTEISSQLNVPIKDVVDTMTVMARTFKTLPEAATATRAALLASKLDQIPAQQSAPYLVGISQAFGLNAKGTLGVVDSLNALQRTYGARVAETLPGLAKAAPAALAAGVDKNTLEALIGVGVRGGLSGSQVATAVARSATTFIQKPANQAILESYGFNPNQSYGALIKQISSFIGERDRSGQRVSGKELRDIAIGLAGPQLGARTFATILARGGDINKFAETAAHPGETAEQERQRQLGAVSEQIHGIGIGIENFGAQLSSSGILLPIQALLSVFHQMASAASTLLSPLAAIGNALGSLPGPLREILGALALGAGAQAAYRTTFGRTAAGAVSRIPGFSFLDSPQSQAVRQIEQTQRVGYDFAKRQQEQSAFGTTTATSEYNRAVAARSSFQRPVEELAPVGSTERTAYDKQMTTLQKAEQKAEQKALEAQETYLTDLDLTKEYQARIRAFKSVELSNAEKLALATEIGAAATPFGAPTTLPIQTAQRARLVELERNAALTPEARAQRLIERGRGQRPPDIGPAPEVSPGGIILPPGSGRSGRASDALESADNEAVANQALRAAEAERPGFIAGKLNRVAGRLSNAGGLAGLFGAAPLQGLAGSGAVGLADRGLSRLGTIPAGLAAGVPGALGTTFQGILAGQLAQAVLPGAAGNFAGGLITGGSLGLGGASLINSILRQNGITNRIGGLSAFAIGAGTSELQSKSTVSNFLGAGLLGGGIGSVLGATGGGLGVGLGIEGLIQLNKLINPIPQDASAAELKQGAPVFHPSSFLGLHGANDIFDALNPFRDNAGNYSKQRQQYEQQLRSYRAQQAQLKSLSGLSAGDVQSFGDVFQQQLGDAFTNGPNAKQDTAAINHQISVLSSQLSLFGGRSQRGQNATALLNEAVGRTVETAGSDPKQLDQYLQIAQKAQQALQQDAQQTFQLANARARTGQDRASALQQLIASEEASIRSSYTDRIGPLNDTLTRLEGQYNDLLAKRGTPAFQQAGGTKKLNAIGSSITATQGSISTLQDAATQQRAVNAATDAQAQVGVYSAIQGDIQAGGALSQARAGTDSLASLRAQLREQRSELSNASANLSLNPEQQSNEMDQINAKILATNQSIAQEVLARIQSAEKLREAQVPLNVPLAAVNKVYQDSQADLRRMQQANANARAQGQGPVFSPEQIQQQQIQVIQNRRATVAQGLQNLQADESLAQSRIPSYDPVAQARGSLSSAEQTAAYIKANAKDFNYSDIIGAMGAVNSARLAVADAIHQQQAQLSQARGEIAKAHDIGDSVAQAQDDINTALRALAAARTPLERAQAAGGLLNAQNARYSAQVARYDTNYDTLSTRATGDAVYQAQIALTRGRYDLSAARGPDEAAKARQEIAQAQVQQHQAAQQRLSEQTQLREARAAGDPVRQAQIARQGAQAALREARGTDEIITAETALATANQQLASARVQRLQQQAQFRETQQTGDAVAQAQTALRAARREQALALTNPSLRPQARQDVAAAQAQLHQANQQRIQERGGLLAAQAQGDPVEQAQIAVQVAQQTLRNARGVDEQITAETALANAQYQLHQAQQQQIIALGALAASTTRDPIKQLQAEMDAAAKALAKATTDAERTSDQTNLNQLQNQYQDALLSQGEQTIDFQVQMRQISTQQAIEGLRKLYDLAGNVTEQQQILLKIHQLQMGGGTGGVFNLAPGTGIKLPTVYDVARAAGGYLNPGAVNAAINAAVQNNITVNVGDASAAPAVYDAIDRATSGGLAAQMRAAGMGG